MFLALWNYLHGYVIIYVTGFSVERFVNLAVIKGVFIWDIEPEKNKVIMKTYSKNIEILKECCIKTGCRFEVIGTYGLPQLVRRCSNKKVYMGGVMAFAVVMYIMSLFIWTVKVEGTERISKDKVLSACEQNGVAPGKLKLGLDYYKVGEQLMIEFDDISWIAVHLKGTEVSVKIVETIPQTQYVDNEIPMDIVANADGKITSIAAATGTPAVAEGDDVIAGDVLISSVVPLKDGETQTGEKQVCASGEVYAERQFVLEASSDLKYNEKVFTGDTKTDYSISIGDKNINIITPSNNSDYEITSDDIRDFSIGDYILPLQIEKTVYAKRSIEEKVRTPEEADKIAEKILNEKITALLMENNASISKLEKEIIEDENNVTVKGYASVIMRIDKQVEAQIKPETDKTNTEEVTE